MQLPDLSMRDFKEFFAEANAGKKPFPWQERLLSVIVKQGWPGCIALPTASGKTHCLDIALFALALAARMDGSAPGQPRRIFYVIDRRIVVDQACDHAMALADALRSARAGILKRVADRLRILSGEKDMPVLVEMMRGGVYREDRWVRSIRQPVIVASTVDQVGSRLLYRGYGLSPRMWPIHAGLIGNDSLILVDEAHCSRPFMQTLHAVARYRKEFAAYPAPVPFRVVELSATPISIGERFELDEKDAAHKVLGRRTSAKKPATLVMAGAKETGFVKSVLGEVRDICEQHTPKALGIIVNRVTTARQIHCELNKIFPGWDILLLTGRSRSLDRDRLVGQKLASIRSGVAETTSETPLLIVATQCIEVGADVDFDALVTEVCPLDALRQRFGRLNRLGNRPETPARILCREEYKAKPDPVYGESLANTWDWLEDKSKRQTIDMGVDSISALLPKAVKTRNELLAKLNSPSEDAPILLPAHCDLLVQTAPEPHVCPEPAAYLHGVRREVAEVQVVWRADLDEKDVDRWAEIVAFCPPLSTEAVQMPLFAVRSWLTGTPVPGVSDIESAQADGEESDKKKTAGQALERTVLRWKGPDDSSLASPVLIRPGDVVVVPASYGGCDCFGWNPQSAEPVPDLAEEARAKRQQYLLRITPVMVEWYPESIRAVARMIASAEEWDERVERGLDELLEGLSVGPDPVWGEVARKLSGSRRTVTPHPSGAGWIIECRGAGVQHDGATDDSGAYFAEKTVTLSAHLADVTRECAVQQQAFDCLKVADAFGRLHDLGKLDPRFQLMLLMGDRLAAARLEEPLAKSPRIPRSPAEFRISRERSGYPQGARHELVSVRIAENAVLEESIRDLVLHLIASHHGHCRPFAPVVVDHDPVAVKVSVKQCLIKGVQDGMTVTSDTGLAAADSGVAERFWGLVRRHGWWGLAWYEALARLADWRASEKEMS